MVTWAMMNNQLITAQAIPPAWYGTVLFLKSRGDQQACTCLVYRTLRMGDTQLDVITARKDLLCGFSRFSGLLAKLVDGDDIRYHHIEATDEH